MNLMKLNIAAALVESTISELIVFAPDREQAQNESLEILRKAIAPLEGDSQSAAAMAVAFGTVFRQCLLDLRNGVEAHMQEGEPNPAAIDKLSAALEAFKAIDSSDLKAPK